MSGSGTAERVSGAGTVERTLSERELNRALLARQFLLKRWPLTPFGAVPRIGGVQAQYAPSIYIGLWSRLENLKRESVNRALKSRWLVQGTLLRATIHLVSRHDWWGFSIAIRDARRAAWLRAHKGDPSAREMAAAARLARRRLARGPLTRAELAELVGRGSVGVNGLSLWLDLVRVPPSGTWERRRADLFALAEKWLGREHRIPQARATAALVRSYLRGFGPATVAEIANWAGLDRATVSEALGSLNLRRFRATDGAQLVDLPRLPLPDPETPAPVRFLPVWDATLLAHARRAQILPEEHRPRVFSTRTPQSVPTFLVDGRVAGAWRQEGSRIRIEPFARLDPAVRREVDAEAERLAAFCA